MYEPMILSPLTHENYLNNDLLIVELQKLISRVFERECITKKEGITADEFMFYANWATRTCVRSLSAVICPDSPSGPDTSHPVAFIITRDPATTPPPSPGDYHIKDKVSEALLEHLSKNYVNSPLNRFPSGSEPGELLHIVVIGVDKNFEKRGLGRQLFNWIVTAAWDAGYVRIEAECTGFGSQALAKNAGFEEHGSLSYDDFVYLDGSRPLSGISESTCVKLMILDKKSSN